MASDLGELARRRPPARLSGGKLQVLIPGLGSLLLGLAGARRHRDNQNRRGNEDSQGVNLKAHSEPVPSEDIVIEPIHIGANYGLVRDLQLASSNELFVEAQQR